MTNPEPTAVADDEGLYRQPWPVWALIAAGFALFLWPVVRDGLNGPINCKDPAGQR